MRNIVELRDETVPVIWTGKTVRLCDLRAEVSKNENSRLVRSNQDRANQKLKLVH